MDEPCKASNPEVKVEYWNDTDWQMVKYLPARAVKWGGLKILLDNIRLLYIIYYNRNIREVENEKM